MNLGWNFENSYSNLPQKFFKEINLNPVADPKLIIVNKSLAKEIGLDSKNLSNEEAISIFAGNKTPEGGIALAQAYAGHQFGHLTMLGDGRALLIGEQITPTGDRVDIQLKGSGRTPYSRGGDGRASLGPMLREYIISEAMHALGVPTTRSLAVVTTGEKVIRQNKEIGAIMTRVALSHLRVGTFQYAANFGTQEEVKALADYAIDRHFKDIKNNINPYISLLEKVIERQAYTIAKWQLVGFVHGVMNTDNMTISGETIDYGPCAFMDNYDPMTVFSSIDSNGRYSYINQPVMANWNLSRFAETLLALLDTDRDKAITIAQEKIYEFNEIYKKNWIKGMRSKLGIFNEEEKDIELIEGLLSLMEKYKSDYSNVFSTLTIGNLQGADIFEAKEFIEWNKLWTKRLKRQTQSKEQVKQMMKQNNPSIIPRNYHVEEALEAATKEANYDLMTNLLKALENPYEYSDIQKYYSTFERVARKPYRTFCGT